MGGCSPNGAHALQLAALQGFGMALTPQQSGGKCYVWNKTMLMMRRQWLAVGRDGRVERPGLAQKQVAGSCFRLGFAQCARLLLPSRSSFPSS